MATMNIAIALITKNGDPKEKAKRKRRRARRRTNIPQRGMTWQPKRLRWFKLTRKRRIENRYEDANYLLDNGSAMMVHKSNNKQVNGITIVEIPGKEGPS
jgi:hypothetical protein